MRDPYFGHRDWFTGEPLGDKDEKTKWDYALISALQVIEDHTNQHGVLIWEIENERMDVDAVKRTDKFQAAVDRKTKGSKKKAYSPDPGEYFVPELRLRGGEWPTYSDYIEDQIKKKDEEMQDGTMG